MSLFGVVENWIEGKQDFSDVESKIVSLVTTTYSKDVQPMLDAFLAQFETDFGKAALAAAATAATSVAGGTSILAAGEALVKQVTSQGVTIAEQDASQVAMNAIRVAMVAQAAPIVTTPVAPETTS